MRMRALVLSAVTLSVTALSHDQLMSVTAGAGSISTKVMQPTYLAPKGTKQPVKSPGGNIVTGIKNPAVVKGKK